VSPDRFLFIRLSSLGDIVHALPAFAALRKGYPGAEIRWLVEPKGRAVLELVPGIDEIIVRGSAGWRKRLRGRDQTALDFQGLLKSAALGRLSGARRRYGFSRPNLREKGAGLFYTKSLRPIPEEGHVIHKNLKLLELVGLAGEEIEFPLIVPEPVRESVRSKLAALGLEPGRKLVILNVGAAWPTKRWPVDRWIELIGLLRGGPASPLLLWGTAEERSAAAAVAARTDTPVAPFFEIGEIFGLLEASAVLVSGDTFALQAACALNIPVVGIFGPTLPGRNGPFRERDKAAYHEISCSRCYKRACDSMECLRLVRPEEVAGMVGSLLDGHD
jgi:heptosyltransferase-1